jgi:putative hydrolase of the HAD superfamily
MPAFRNLVFDLGGVLFAIDPPRTIAALMALRRADAGLPRMAEAHALFDQLEAGLIDPPDFRAALRAVLALDADDAAIDRAWNALLLGVIPGRAEALAMLRQRYRLILLSNTNSIHQAEIRVACTPLFAQFERLFFSQDMHLRKPDPEIYLQALAASDMAPAESLFIDDNLPNVAGAQAAGLHGFHFDLRDPMIWEKLIEYLA